MRDSGRLFVLAAGAILFYQLMLPPIVGLADNGDFVKIIGRFGLHARVHRTYEAVDTVYYFRPNEIWVGEFRSIEILLTQAAVWFNGLISKDGNFDLRCIGIVHGATFLTAIWLFVPLLDGASRGVRWVVYGLALFFFCDMIYVNSFNSFYMDESAYLFLLLTVVLFLRVLKWHRPPDAVFLILCTFLMVFSKTQHAPLGLWLAILLLAAANSLKSIRPLYWHAAAVGLVTAVGLMVWKAQPPDYSLKPLYSVTFEEILPHSRDPGATLAQLGLDDSYRFCIGKKAFVPGSGIDDPAFVQRFSRQFSFGKLAGFYVRHPSVAYRTMRHALSEAGRQHAFGNFDLSTGLPPSTETRAFAEWSDIKSHFFKGRGSVFLFTFLTLATLLCALLAIERHRLPAGTVAAGLGLIAAAITEMCVSMLCDSMDITRHAMIFFALFDMIVLACVYLLASWLAQFTWGRSR